MAAPQPSPMAISIRDALGLVRLLYAARRAQDPTLDATPDPLVAIGRELRAALELAHHEVGSLGHRAAGIGLRARWGASRTR